MTLDPTAMTPSAGAGLPIAGGIAPKLARPVGANLIGGTLPASQSYTGTVYTTNVINDHFRRQARLLAAGGSIPIFGDSNAAGCGWSDIPFAENYGIAGDTLAGLITRLRSSNYGSLANARAIVLANFAFNDICVASPNLTTIETMYASVLSYFTGPIVILPPTRTSTSAWNTNIATFNAWIASTYGARSQCQIVDISDLQDGSGAAISGWTLDGQHWAAVLQNIIVGRVAAALRLV